MDRHRLLVVCTANICRSPMVERLLAEYLVRQAPDAAIEVTSAGTRARPGYHAADGMQVVAQRWGLDLSRHRSRRVDAALVASQTLIVTSEHEHSSVVSKLAPGVGQRTFTLTELDALLEALGLPDPGVGLPAAVASWHAARARLSLSSPDIDDPYRGPQEGYDACAWQLAGLVQRIGAALATATDASADEPDEARQ